MSAIAAPASGGRTLVIRGTAYPVLLPRLSDPRLHLASVIVSLQVLGQVAFGFDLSISQILLSLGTCALLELGIEFRRRRVIMWPASAMLTGNGVAFILRVPGTHHGDWWSLRGWWIFVGTAAVSLLSKHLIKIGGSHVFNPSNFGLVLCFLALGSARSEPLYFWWGPMSVWLAVAIVIILAGGLAILSRLHMLVIAFGFWLAFAAGIGLLAATGHAMTARWHTRPDHGDLLLVGARHLAGDPRLPLLHDHRPEDDADPHTVTGGLRDLDRPAGGAPERAGAHGVLEQGRSARGARDRLRRPAPARAPAVPSARAEARRGRNRDAAGRVHRCNGGCRHPGAAAGDRASARPHRPPACDLDPALPGRRELARPEDGRPHRRRPRRRSRPPGRRAGAATHQRAPAIGDRRRADAADEAGPRRVGRHDRGGCVAARTARAPPGGRARPGAGDCRRDARRNASARGVQGCASRVGAARPRRSLPRDARAAAGSGPLARRAYPERAAGSASCGTAGEPCRPARRRRGVRRRAPRRTSPGRPGSTSARTPSASASPRTRPR